MLMQVTAAYRVYDYDGNDAEDNEPGNSNYLAVLTE